jgi:hypothetical protein
MTLKRASWKTLQVGDIIQFGPNDRGIVTKHSHRAAPFGPGYGVTYRPVPADYAGEGFRYNCSGTHDHGEDTELYATLQRAHTFPYASYLDMDRTRYEFPYGATAANRYGRIGARVHVVKRAS